VRVFVAQGVPLQKILRFLMLLCAFTIAAVEAHVCQTKPVGAITCLHTQQELFTHAMLSDVGNAPTCCIQHDKPPTRWELQSVIASGCAQSR
jgi:hypothetical protein